MRVAFFGELGSYTELAARNYFKPGAVLVPCQVFGDVFAAVERGKSSYGVIPIENSLTGSIHQNYDLLLHHKLHIVGEIFLGVSHNLIALKGVPRRSLKQIFSHPQGLAQCERYLKNRRT
jgi:3-deoxy-7-phosphoheptulonate synthase